MARGEAAVLAVARVGCLQLLSACSSYHEDEEFSEEEAEAATAALPDARRGLEWDDSTLATNGGKQPFTDLFLAKKKYHLISATARTYRV